MNKTGAHSLWFTLKSPNKLKMAKLEQLVFIHYNMMLRARKLEEVIRLMRMGPSATSRSIWIKSQRGWHIRRVAHKGSSSHASKCKLPRQTWWWGSESYPLVCTSSSAKCDDRHMQLHLLQVQGIREGHCYFVIVAWAQCCQRWTYMILQVLILCTTWAVAQASLYHELVKLALV